MAQPSRLSRLPLWISHWLGYRRSDPKAQLSYIVYFWSFVGAFSGVALVQAVFGQAQYFIARNVPSIVPSYGASAVLCYGIIGVPVAQPRALVFGHLISALTGICVQKLFDLLPSEQRIDSLRWLSGSIATALAVVAMEITDTTHPPAGATALLAAINPEIYGLSWYYLPVVLLSSVLILVTALLLNNIQRRYPVFWIAPSVPGPLPNASMAGEKINLTKSSIPEGSSGGLPNSDVEARASSSNETLTSRG